MKVLHLISSGGMYGAEAVILSLSHTLAQMGEPCSLGVFQTSPETVPELHQIATQQGLDSHLVPCRGQLDRGMPARIRELVGRTGAELVHAHGYKADVYAWWALRSGGVPLVSTCHNWIDNDLALSLYGRLDRRVLRGYRRIAAVSPAVRQRLIDSGVPEGKVEIVGNGVDLQAFDGIPPALVSSLAADGGPIVGLIGRLSVEKGIDLLVRAAAIVLRSFPSAHFVVVGDGPERAQLQSLIDEQQISRQFTLIGRRNDMAAIYASLTILVSASRIEGLPIALLEGMASRLPIVATSVGAVPKIVRDGITGLLVPPEDPQALASGIMTLLADGEQRQRLGTGARQLVEDEYSARRMAIDYKMLYAAAAQTDV
jgi:glycosyltransferase involved in cell wall biosynthesis